MVGLKRPSPYLHMAMGIGRNPLGYGLRFEASSGTTVIYSKSDRPRFRRDLFPGLTC
jgi:hypothetical protein